jgi:hypothetical protein
MDCRDGRVATLWPLAPFIPNIGRSLIRFLYFYVWGLTPNLTGGNAKH